MAKLSLVKQFEEKVKSIAEIKTMKTPKRRTNRGGHTEYISEVVFSGHENNAFSIYWDSVTDRYFVSRSVIERKDGWISHRTEVFSPEYYVNGSLETATQFIKDTWDKLWRE